MHTKIPEPIERLNTFFHRSTPQHRKKQEFIWLFKFVNLNFMKCNEACRGLEECDCVDVEIDKFCTHFNEKTKNVKYEKDINHTKVLGTYLSDKDLLILNIVNVNRIIEVALLMKAAQSSTERVNSMIGNAVAGNYDGKYVNPEITLDMVNPIVCCKCNSNIEKLDASKARDMFVGEKPHGLGHRESLFKTKDKMKESKTIKRIQRNLLVGYKKSKNRGHKRINASFLISSKKKDKRKKSEIISECIRHTDEDEEEVEDEGLEIINAIVSDDRIIEDHEKLQHLSGIDIIGPTNVEATHQDTLEQREEEKEEQEQQQGKEENEKEQDETRLLNKYPKMADSSGNKDSDLIFNTMQVEVHAEDSQCGGTSIDECQGDINTENYLLRLESSDDDDADVYNINEFIDKAKSNRTHIDNLHFKHTKDNQNNQNSNESINDVYCECKEPYSIYIRKKEKYRNDMVECKNSINCKSYKDQLEKEHKSGANWFHFQCVKFQPKSVRGKKTQIFYCKKCSPAKNNPQKRLKSYLAGDGHCKEIVNSKGIRNNKDLIYITICQYEERKRQTESIERMKTKIKEKFKILCNPEYVLMSQSEKVAQEAINLLLKNNDLDRYLEDNRCLLDYVQIQNIDVFNKIVLYIYSVVAEKRIYILELMDNKNTYIWSSLLKETSFSSYLSLIKEKNHKFNIIRHRKNPPKDGQKYLCTNPALRYSQ